MGSGKGFDFYRNNYTHDELWAMLSMGDSWSVEQAGGVWRTARGDIESARDNLDTAMQEVTGYWEGDASEEYQRRMFILRDFGDESAESMRLAEERILPNLAGHLSESQQQARDQDLYPGSTIDEYERWLDETKPADLAYGTSKEETQRPQLQREYQDYLEDRHDKMARIVADLGDKYQSTVPETWREPPPPPPSDMPGNETYNPPTGGVFGSDGLNPAGGANGAFGSAPGGSAQNGGSLAGADGIVGTDDDLEPVDSWNPDSYGNVDSGVNAGGLAAGTIGGPGGGFTGGSVAPTAGGGGMGAGAGLFGPAASGAGGTGGRGTTTSPARSGASGNNTRSGTSGNNNRGTGGRGGNTTGGRPGSSTRGLNSGRNNMGGRGGTRSGYSEDDEEEEYSRETWLREDDVNWSSNRVPDEELDD